MINKIHLGDCLEVMKNIPDNSVDLILTDPPYYKVVKTDWDKCFNKIDDYSLFMFKIAKEFYRVLSDNGSLYIFGDDKYIAYTQIKTTLCMKQQSL